MAELAILNTEGKASGKINLPDESFGGHVNNDVIHQAVTMYRASLRQGNASTKTRDKVSGGGKKPFKQKGTGRARAGSSRSPLWHGGGVTFGPQPRDFGYTLPKKIRTAAVRESLKAKLQSENLLCLEDITKGMEKTKDFAAVLKNLGLTRGKILAALDGSDQSVQRISKNIPRFNLIRSQDINAFDIMSNKKLLVSKTAIENLIKRVAK